MKYYVHVYIVPVVCRSGYFGAVAHSPLVKDLGDGWVESWYKPTINIFCTINYKCSKLGHW